MIKTGDVQLERARPDDWESVKNVRLAALKDAPYAFGSTYEREVGRAEADWRKWVGPDDTTDNVVILAHEADSVIGIVAAFKEDKSTAHLVSMWVAPSARRRGVGAALVNAVLAWAFEVGVRSVVLDVAEGNEAASALYERMGFQRTGKSQALPSAPDRLAWEYILKL